MKITVDRLKGITPKNVQYKSKTSVRRCFLGLMQHKMLDTKWTWVEMGVEAVYTSEEMLPLFIMIEISYENLDEFLRTGDCGNKL